ncbi:MAG: Gfo/Idh/MocA family oxidoreductase [Eubacteriales bacterium]|nr:Gfo/Idh/MocA family oxidoreductase [Eubacteriales bacterium]
MLNFAIAGVGGLGKVHLFNMIQLEKIRDDIKLTALCDIEEKRIYEGTTTNLNERLAKIDLNQYRIYTDVNEMLNNEKLDFIITALPTYLHDKVAISALEKGVHVFSEKPMALSLEKCANMINAAKHAGKKLMIGQCLRYSKKYIKLRDYALNNELGKIIKAHFYRYSHTPAWSWQNWMLDEAKSGGAALDMHVHDTDFINWVFGKPVSVQSMATNIKTGFDSITTIYDYGQHKFSAIGDWSLPGAYPFTPGFLAGFEHGALELKGSALTLYTEKEGASELKIENENQYRDEIIDFISCIQEGRDSLVNTPESCMQTIEIALAEKESAQTGQKIYL